MSRVPFIRLSISLSLSLSLSPFSSYLTLHSFFQVCDRYDVSTSGPGSQTQQEENENQEEKQGKELIYGVKLPRTLNELAERLVQRQEEEEESQGGCYGENLSGSLFGGMISPGRGNVSPPPYQTVSPTFNSNPLQEATRITNVVCLSQRRVSDSDRTMGNQSSEGEGPATRNLDRKTSCGSYRVVYLDHNDHSTSIGDEKQSYGVPLVGMGKTGGISSGSALVDQSVSVEERAGYIASCKLVCGEDDLNDSGKNVVTFNEPVQAQKQKSPAQPKNVRPSKDKPVCRAVLVHEDIQSVPSRDNTAGTQGCDHHGNKEKRPNQSKSSNEIESTSGGKQCGEKSLRGLFRKPWVSNSKRSGKSEKLEPAPTTHREVFVTPSYSVQEEQLSPRSETESYSSYEQRFPNARVLLLEGSSLSSSGGDSDLDLDDEKELGFGKCDGALRNYSATQLYFVRHLRREGDRERRRQRERETETERGRGRGRGRGRETETETGGRERQGGREREGGRKGGRKEGYSVTFSEGLLHIF